MQIITYGTRGSMPVSGSNKVKYGGNTTCVQIQSSCIPADMVLALDAGTGIVPCSARYIAERPILAILQTHSHWDHIFGLISAPHAFYKGARIHLYGPAINGNGPVQDVKDLFTRRHFPVEFGQIENRITSQTIESPGSQVIAIHPKAGLHLLSVAEYLRAINGGTQLRLGDRQYDAGECMVITMYKTAHPDYAISYRVVENPTGKVLVFMTDHEKQADHPKGLLDHVRGANVLIQDAQYTEEMYATRTAGFGHGTPRYCVDLAIRARVKKLYLTHHDPMATDADIDQMVEDARWYSRRVIEPLPSLGVAAAYDYMKIPIE